ncbi:hypothetical protein SAMN05444157_1619 [Frankineae bacterium MT45]|nr:hypothetical protein SAMN05444157_1619 [Frankineae bacterium MT45]
MTSPNFGNNVTLVAAGTVVTAAGTSAVLEPDNKGDARLALAVTAASGTTPSLTVNIQTSSDGGVTDSWRTAASFSAVTGVTTVHLDCVIDRFVRAQWGAPSGTTPSFTIGISGELV